MSLYFLVLDKDFEITKDFYKENSWFFKNYISMACKLAAESILKYTPMYELELPWTPQSIPHDSNARLGGFVVAYTATTNQCLLIWQGLVSKKEL